MTTRPLSIIGIPSCLICLVQFPLPSDTEILPMQQYFGSLELTFVSQNQDTEMLISKIQRYQKYPITLLKFDNQIRYYVNLYSGSLREFHFHLLLGKAIHSRCLLRL